MSRRGWSTKQDEAVIKLVQKHGTKNWASVSYELCHDFNFKERTGKQCRERYHNHLDPTISKHTWTPQQQAILFKMHKTYGNKWTSIAQHLKGRTDNTLKNHFYSTIRRSLRRMSKLVGSKNSTQKMKYIKPSSLSKIFSINTKPTSLQQIEEQRKKCSQSQAYRNLVDYIDKNCNDLTDIILEFSSYKPKGKDCVLPPDERIRFQQVLQKMVTLNQIYEKMRKQHKKINASFNVNDQSDSESGQGEESQQEQVKVNTKVTRSKRQIKPPKKFQTQLLKIKPIKRQRKQLIILRKNSQIAREIKEKFQKPNKDLEKPEYQSEKHQEQFLGQKMEAEYEMEKKEQYKNENIQNLMENDEMAIQFKDQHEFNMYQIQIGQTPAAHTPNYYFNTPALQFQSPAGGVSATSTGANNIFAHINSMWNVKAGELDDIASSLGNQIAAKSSQQNRGTEQHRQDGRTSSSSNINCSPNSAFKSCQ